MLAAMTVLPPQSCWGGSVDTPFSGISCITHAGSGLGPWYIGHIMHKTSQLFTPHNGHSHTNNQQLNPDYVTYRNQRVKGHHRRKGSNFTKNPVSWYWDFFWGDSMLPRFWLGQEAIVPTKYAGSLTDHVGDCQWKDSWNCYQTSSHSFTIYELIPGAQW